VAGGIDRRPLAGVVVGARRGAVVLHVGSGRELGSLAAVRDER
jgi:hypothetical protein